MSSSSARLDLCARLFTDPSRVVGTLTHEVRGAYSIAPHHHDDLLQFDLLVGCRGRALIGNDWHPLAGVSAMVCPPGVSHGYELERRGPVPCRVYHLKLRVDPAWPVVKTVAYPELLVSLAKMESLQTAFRVVVQLGYLKAAKPPTFLPRLTEVLCIWPGSPGGSSSVSANQIHDDLPPGLAATVSLIDDRLADPPAVDELATLSGYSLRHFNRQFLSRFACTPHHYITQRRVALARGLLLDPNLKVHEVATQLGFSSVAIFSRWFRREVGRSPREHRESPAEM
jgi:AraC family transcriptional activator of pobA